MDVGLCQCVRACRGTPAIDPVSNPSACTGNMPPITEHKLAIRRRMPERSKWLMSRGWQVNATAHCTLMPSFGQSCAYKLPYRRTWCRHDQKKRITAVFVGAVLRHAERIIAGDADSLVPGGEDAKCPLTLCLCHLRPVRDARQRLQPRWNQITINRTAPG